MNQKNLVAGVIEASCTCCPQARELLNHVQLGPSRRFCPDTGQTYLDRGDGVYQGDAQVLGAEARGTGTPTSDLLSDRPAKTADKTRITLERATFA